MFWITFLEPARDVERVAVLYDVQPGQRATDVIKRIADEVVAQFGAVRLGVVTQARNNETRTMLVGGMDEPVFTEEHYQEERRIRLELCGRDLYTPLIGGN